MYFYRFFLLLVNPFAPCLDLDSDRLYNISQRPLILYPLSFVYPRLGPATPSGYPGHTGNDISSDIRTPVKVRNQVFVDLGTDSQSLIFFSMVRPSSGPISTPLHTLWRLVSC